MRTRYTQLAALVDPDPVKEPSDISLELFVRNADYIFVGGTPSDSLDADIEGYTTKFINRFKAKRDELGLHTSILIFPGAPQQAVPGADGILYLFVPNSMESLFGWGIQIQSIEDVLKNYKMDQIHPTMYIPLGGKARTYVNGEVLDNEDLVKSVKIANMLNFEYFYLEGGSGAEMVDIEDIKSISKVLKKKLIYGGGVKTEEKVRSLYGVADIINMGTVLEEDPSFVEVARKVLDELRSKESKTSQ